MLKNYWYPIVQENAISAKPVRIQRFNRHFVLWKETSSGEVLCLEDRCPHRGASLSQGKIVDGELQCPYHGFRYDREGLCTHIPQNGEGSRVPASLRVARYALRVAHGMVWIWWGNPSCANEKPLPWFSQFPEKHPRLITGSKIIPVSFGRWMESMLDDAHFEFVHTGVKIPNSGPVADPYHCVVEGDLIKTWGEFREEGKNSGAAFKNWVLFPNLMYTEMESQKIKGVICSAPVDERRTWIAVRYCQDKLKVPVLSHLYGAYMKYLALGPILEQDLRIQRLQEPKETGLGTDKLIGRADRGMLEYWRLWTEAKEKERSGSIPRTSSQGVEKKESSVVESSPVC